MSTWLDDLVSSAQNRLGTGVWSSSDPEAWTQRASATNDAYRQAITSPIDGAAPQRSNYLSLVPSSYTGDTLTKAGYRFDAKQYAADMYPYMRGQEQYADWSDSDIQTFIAETMNMGDDQKRAEELWTDSSIAYRKAQKDAEADRNSMLGELATYKDQMLSSNWVDDLVSQEAGRWNARNQGILKQVEQQTANMGRTVSPYLLGDLARRLQAQASAAIQEVRVSAEQQQEQKRQYYLSALNSVYQNTKREVMDPVTAAAMIKQIAAAGGGSGSGLSGGGSGSGSSSSSGGSSGGGTGGASYSAGGTIVAGGGQPTQVNTGVRDKSGTIISPAKYSWYKGPDDLFRGWQGPEFDRQNILMAYIDPNSDIGTQSQYVSRDKALEFYENHKLIE